MLGEFQLKLHYCVQRKSFCCLLEAVFTYRSTRSAVRYKTEINDVHELRERIVDEWDKLDERIINKPLDRPSGES